MEKVISYSLWGEEYKYCAGAIKNAKDAKVFYPDWICYFYITNNVPYWCVNELSECDNVKVIVCNDPPNWKFATKRFKAIDEENVKRVIFRDTDSRLSKREVDAVNEWISEDTALHIMKDHPYHGGFPILAGMFGLYKGHGMPCISEWLEEFEETEIDPNYYHYDQMFLKYVFNCLKGSCTIHDEFFENKPFPTPRQGFEFVGQVFDEFGKTDPNHTEALEQATK